MSNSPVYDGIDIWYRSVPSRAQFEAQAKEFRAYALGPASVTFNSLFEKATLLLKRWDWWMKTLNRLNPACSEDILKQAMHDCHAHLAMLSHEFFETRADMAVIAAKGMLKEYEN